MKLLKTKTMPKVNHNDILYAEDFLTAMLEENRSLEFTTKYFSADAIDYLNERRKNLTLTRVNKTPTIIQTAMSKIVGFNIDVDQKDCKVTVSIYTTNSALTEVKTFLINALDTTSKLNEVKGKYQRLSNNYVYKLVLDMHDGDYDPYGKVPSAGILRLITLVDILLMQDEMK